MIDPNDIPSQTLLGWVLRLPFRLLPDGLDIPIVSGPNKGMKWRTGASVHGCWVGTYEAGKVELLRRFVQPGMVAYDIGANAGYYTLLLSHLVGATGRVYSFEPLPENLVNLIHHVRVNGLANARVIEAAVSDRAGLTGFQVAGSNSMGSLSDSETGLSVPTVSLDSLVDSGAVPPADFVKMDVEGAEALVLAGAPRLLRSRPATWFVALHGAEPARATARAFLDAGFRVFDLTGAAVDEGSASELDEIYAVKDS